jgi:4-amino-4-deoxy-L-arabinose transferase-like glycosyltransferase
VVGSVLGLLHLCLFVFDVFNPDGFLRADRADERIKAVRTVIEAAGNPDVLVDALVRLGLVFDYGIHAVLFGLGGRLGVVAFQVVLAMAATLSLVYIARQAFRSDGFAVVVGLVYGLLPQSIAFPHQLLTESIANPLIIMGTAAFVWALTDPRRVSAWLCSGVLFGIGGAVRPALILLPLLAVTLTIVTRTRPSAKHAALFVAASLAPLLGWCFFMLVQTGRFGLGDSGQDLGLNLTDSVVKVLLSVGVGPPDGSRPEWLPLRISLSEYFGYLREYPLGFLNLYFKNVFVMVADSGIGRLYVDLLGFGAEARLRLQDPVLGWRAQLTNH